MAVLYKNTAVNTLSLSMRKISVLAHANCSDGTLAAYVCWRVFGGAAEYHYVNYQSELPEIEPRSAVFVVDFSLQWRDLQRLMQSDCAISLLDHHDSALCEYILLLPEFDALGFCARVGDRPIDEWMEIWQDSGLADSTDREAQLRWIEDYVDEHQIRKLEIRDGQPANRFHVEINLDYSGAGLVWHELNAGRSMPDLVSFVQASDLWQFGRSNYVEEVREGFHNTWLYGWREQRLAQQRLEVARLAYEIPAAQSSTMFLGFNPKDPLSLSSALISYSDSYLRLDAQAERIAEFEYLHDLVEDLNYVTKMIEIGRPLVEERRQVVRQLCEAHFWVTIGGYRVPIAQGSKHHSWIGHELCQMHPDVPFAAVWRRNHEGSISIDLRSEPERHFRVNRVARQYGGGGHPCAAGFRWSAEFGIEIAALPL